MSDDLFTRDEVLGGLPARRANTLLFLIECRTAQLMVRSQQVTDDFLPEEAVRERDQAFLEAFSLGKQLPLRPKIQDLEQYALQWAHLVPERNTKVQAAIAHRLSQKYHFTYSTVPNLRMALGLDLEAVQHAFERLYHEPLESIYAPQISGVENLRWAIASFGKWLESLPPFWLAFLFTVAANFSQSVLALPIAVAGIGPLPALAFLLVVGVVNMFTIACMAEAVTRNGSIRYGSSFLGRLVTDYLGKTAALVLTFAVVLISVLGLLGSALGLSFTMARFTGIVAPLWTVLLMLIIVYRLWREARNFGVASMILMGGVGIVAVVILGGLALTQFNGENFRYAHLPTLQEIPLEVAAIAPVLGGIFGGFMGSNRVPHCAKMILPRDPSGRSLTWGSVAGTAATLVLLSFWLIAVNGVVTSQDLLQQRGTSLDPLVEAIGPSVKIIGSVVVCLTLGLSALRASDLLFNLVRERLPTPSLLDRVLQLIREGKVSSKEIAACIGQDEKSVRSMMERLRESGLVELGKGRLPTASAISSPQMKPKIKTWLASSLLGRFCLCVSPVIGIFILTEWLLLTGNGSFASLLSLIGVIGTPITAGIFPILLLAAARKKGEMIPGVAYSFLSHPVFLVGIYLFFLANLLLHGAVIWQGIGERAIAIAVSLLVIGVTVRTIQLGAFTPRVVVELREDQRQNQSSIFALTANGQPLTAEVQLTYQTGLDWGLRSRTPKESEPPTPILAATAAVNFTSLHSVRFQLPFMAAKELKVWVHRVTPEGDSEGIFASLTVNQEDQTCIFNFKGQKVIALKRSPVALEVSFTTGKPHDLRMSH